MMQGAIDKINNEIREKGKDENPIPRVPPVTRAVIPVRDHLCPPLLLCVSTAAAAILYNSLFFNQNSNDALLMVGIFVGQRASFTHTIYTSFLFTKIVYDAHAVELYKNILVDERCYSSKHSIGLVFVCNFQISP